MPVVERASVAGGTSMAASSSSRLIVVILLAAAAILAVVVVAVMLTDDPAPDPGPVAERPGGVVEIGSPSADVGRAGRASPRLIERAERSVGAGVSAAGRVEDVVRDLNSQLRRQRLWSTVAIDRIDPSVIIIQSSLCNENGLPRVVSAASAELRSSGVTAVRCVAPHGEVVFEKVP